MKGGGINDADYATQTVKDGKYCTCPYYSAWRRMLASGIPVCDEWLRFSAFRRWMRRQKWEKKALDRWLKGNGQLYSPETCCFLDRQATNLCKSFRLAEDIGIDKPGAPNLLSKPYRAVVCSKHIGYFATLKEARKAWREAALVELKKRLRSPKLREAADRLYAQTKTLSNRS